MKETISVRLVNLLQIEPSANSRLCNEVGRAWKRSGKPALVQGVSPHNVRVLRTGELFLTKQVGDEWAQVPMFTSEWKIKPFLQLSEAARDEILHFVRQHTPLSRGGSNESWETHLFNLVRVRGCCSVEGDFYLYYNDDGPFYGKQEEARFAMQQILNRFRFPVA